jgi:hypothetical protein
MKCTFMGRVSAYQVWDKVELDRINDADVFGPNIEDERHDTETDIGGDNSVPLVGFKKRRGRLKVLSERLERQINSW